MILKWINLYVSFSGYTDIAIGSSRLYGIRILENFNFPLLADNIQNFWQRWHISLAGFVNKYIFLQLVRRTGKVEICLFITFLLMGLWHDMGINYLVWGIMHGSAMTLHFQYKRRIKNYPRIDLLRKNWIYLTCCRILTISFISYVSVIGQSDDINKALDFTKALFSF